MYRMRSSSLIIWSFCFFMQSSAQSTAQPMNELIRDQFLFAAQQLQVLGKNVPDSLMPRTFNPKTGAMVTSDTKWWCSGFFPASLLYVYEHTKDSAVLSIAKKRLAIQEKEKHYTGNHDLGFMIFNPFGNAYRILGNPEYRNTIDTAALSLVTRYRELIQSIQSWNSNKTFSCPVIIDNMMNLELLLYVSQQGANPQFREIALKHANTTIRNHYRNNYSAFHVLDYDLLKGTFVGKNHQGYNDGSTWARGQAWGLYGFVMVYRYTQDKKYLDFARNIASFLLDHPRMPQNLIPYWDFDAPNIPNALRDASAAAILSSAFLELSLYTDRKEKERYIRSAETIIRGLASAEYRTELGQNGGFLIKHGVGHLPANSEVDQPLTYGDYYFLESLHRYQEWVVNGQGFLNAKRP